MFNPVAFSIDDEAGILSAMRRILRGTPLALRCFGSPAEALEALGSEKPAVVVSDYRMPGMTGIELLEKFKARSPNTTRILLTGFVDLESSLDAINRGSVYRIVRKPWEDEELRTAILAGAAESVTIRASSALRRFLGGLIGASTEEEALESIARFLDGDSGLGLPPPSRLPEAEPAEGGGGEGALRLSVPAPGPSGSVLAVSIPRPEVEAFEAAGLGRILADIVESALGGLRIALEAIGARSNLVELSEHDPLSGLLNRRAMTPRIESECARRGRYGRTLAVVLFDVDRFKLINDRYGHAKGDAVISGIGKAIAASCRTVDIAARIGGDEFLIGMPETDEEGARVLARRLGEKVAVLGEELGLEDKLTLSIGLAVAPPDAVSCIDDILQQADASMYKVKRAGRDGIGTHATEAPRPEAESS